MASTESSGAPVGSRGRGDSDGSSSPLDPVFVELVETLPEAAFVVDREGTITHWNSAVTDLLGLPASKAVGLNAYDVFGTEGEEETLAETVIRTGEPVREESFRSAEDADGELAHARAVAAPLRAGDGEVVGAIEFLLDVTDVVERQESLRELQREFSEEVEAEVAEIGGNAESVAARSDDISGITTEQVEELERVRSEISGFSATVEEIASSAEQVSRRAATVTNLGEESIETTETLVDRAEAVAAESERMAENASMLGERVEEVAEFVEVIDGIADKTNMLALNANIEAARGEGNHGGFEVVANEIKELADESVKHSGRVEETVSEIREVAAETETSVHETNDEIQEIGDALEEIRRNQEEILSAATETDDGIAEIADATDDQAVAAEEVASMADEAAERAGEASDAVDELARANRDQSERLEAIEESIHRVDARMDELLDGT